MIGCMTMAAGQNPDDSGQTQPTRLTDQTQVDTPMGMGILNPSRARPTRGVCVGLRRVSPTKVADATTGS